MDAPSAEKTRAAVGAEKRGIVLEHGVFTFSLVGDEALGRGMRERRWERDRGHQTTRRKVTSRRLIPSRLFLGKGGNTGNINWALTLATNAPVPSNADPLADPVGGAAQLTAVGAPDMVDLPLVLQMVVFTRDQRRQDDPFRDRRPVDARRRRDGYLAVRHDRVSHPAVDPRGEQVDELQTVRGARTLGLRVCGKWFDIGLSGGPPTSRRRRR